MFNLSGRCYLPDEDLLVELREAIIQEVERRFAEASVVTAIFQQVSQLIQTQLVSSVLQRVLVVGHFNLVSHLAHRHDR